MESEETDLEEGEIPDEDIYTPLERPSNYSSTIPQRLPPTSQQPESDESEDLLSASETDSDAECFPAKKAKVKPKLKPKPTNRAQSQKKKKYDIWSTRAQEDVLAETLSSCDVSVKDRSRNVESYDYTLGFRVRRGNKRNMVERDDRSFRQMKREDGGDEEKGSKRSIMDLGVSVESSAEEIASDMANKLCEEKEDLLLRIINVAGKEKAFEVFKETQRIEKEGGMLIMNGTRRRTPGGVFLFLIRHDDNITQENLREIFEEDRQNYKQAMKKKQKLKSKIMKQKLRAEIQNSKNLPELLTRAELLTSESNRNRKEPEHLDVVNPPPTPETDCHENSGDGMDIVNKSDALDSSGRKVESYEEDFLDLGCGNKMDVF